MGQGRQREGEETVLHFLSEFSMNLEHKRNVYPRIIGVIIKEIVKSLIFWSPFVPSPCSVVGRTQPGSRELHLSRKLWVLWDFAGFLITFIFPCFLELILSLASINLKVFEDSVLIEGFGLLMLLFKSMTWCQGAKLAALRGGTAGVGLAPNLLHTTQPLYTAMGF